MCGETDGGGIEFHYHQWDFKRCCPMIYIEISRTVYKSYFPPLNSDFFVILKILNFHKGTVIEEESMLQVFSKQKS